VIFTDATGTVLTDSLRLPFVEPLWYPLSVWTVGDTITTTTVASELGDSFEAYVAIVASEDYADVAARLPPQGSGSDGAAQTIKSTNMVRLPMVVREKGLFGGSLSLPREQHRVRDATPSGTAFGSALALHSVQVSPSHLRSAANRTADSPSDGSLTVLTHWSRLANIDNSLAMSLRLLDEAGNVLVQVDGPFHSGLYPPQEWPLNSIVSSSITMSVPADAAAGTYTAVLIVYDRETLKPLPLDSGAQQLTLAPVTVN
jgi:hypothetical protein